MSPPKLELWQTEWCPASHRVRQRMTELGLTYTVRQVPVGRDQRTDLEAATGLRSIPVLIAGGQVIDGEEAIVAYLEAHFNDPPDAQQQRDKAAKAKHKELEEACRRLAAVTH
jgi:glutathione S-transferase